MKSESFTTSVSNFDFLSDLFPRKILNKSSALFKNEEGMTSGNLQSYWTTTKLRELTVVLDYYEALETYSRIGPIDSSILESRFGHCIAIQVSGMFSV